MFDDVAEAVRFIGERVAQLDPALLAPGDAVALLDTFSLGKRFCSAGEVLCAGRAAETGAHVRAGSRSAADWLARRTGQSVGEAIGALQTAKEADGSALGEALRAGELSGQQAAVVADAVAVDPDCAEELLQAARREPLKLLRERAKAAKAAGSGEAGMLLSEDQQRRKRYLRTWAGGDGGLHGEFALAPLDGARFLSALEVEQRAAFEAARRRGEHERSEAYAADALLALAERPAGDGRATPTLLLTCDLAAFQRGSVQQGETCEVPGIGPVPVATARAVVGEAFLKMVVTDGVDVRTVTHLGRTVPAHVRTALEVRDPRCVVPTCGETRLLEIDHWRVPFANGGPTTLDNLCRVCRSCHRKKTHQGFVLDGGPGKWTWTPPRVFVDPPPGGFWDRQHSRPPDVPPAERAASPEDRPPPGEESQPPERVLELALF
jgi:hypothetical protein